jgi:TIR domain
MKIFISHASKDAPVARQLAEELKAAGHSVWNPEKEVLPGDNWAKKVGQALEDADLIVVLVTRHAFDSQAVTRDIQYALTAEHIKGRLIPVYLGPESKPPTQMPWILQKLEPLRIKGKKRDWQKVIDKVDALAG